MVLDKHLKSGHGKSASQMMTIQVQHSLYPVICLSDVSVQKVAGKDQTGSVDPGLELNAHLGYLVRAVDPV